MAFLTALPSFLHDEIPSSLPPEDLDCIPSPFLGPISAIENPFFELDELRWLFPGSFVLRTSNPVTFSLPPLCKCVVFTPMSDSCLITTSAISHTETVHSREIFCDFEVTFSEAFTVAPNGAPEAIVLIICDSFPIVRKPNNCLLFADGFCYLRWFISTLDFHETFLIGSLLGAYPDLAEVYRMLLTRQISHLPCTLTFNCHVGIYHVEPRSGPRVSVHDILFLPNFPIGGDEIGQVSNNECFAAATGARIRLDPSSKNLLSAVGFTDDKDCADIIRSLFVDRNSRLRGEVDKLLAQRWTDEKFSNQRSRKKVTIYQQLDTAEERALEASYPEFDISFNPQQFVSHAFAAASRKLETELLLSLCGYSRTSKPPRGFMACIIDIGGNWSTHIAAKRPYIHSCCPILSGHDDLREATRREFLNNLYLPPLSAETANNSLSDAVAAPSEATKTTPLSKSVAVSQSPNAVLHHLVSIYRDKRTRCRIRCSKRTETCRVLAPHMLSIHSAYDMTPEQLCLSMLSHNATTLRGSLIFSPELLLSNSGVLMPLGCRFDRNDRDDLITFSFVDDPSLTYSHKFSSYRRLFCEPVIEVGAPSVRFYIDLQRNRCGVQFFTIRRGTNVEVPRCTMSRNLWLPTAENRLAVRYYSFDVRAKNLRSALVPRVFTVPRGHFEKIYQFALRLSDQKFNVNDLFNYACSINNRLIIDGASVGQPESISTNDLVDLTHATYIHAYCKRYNLGRIDKEAIETIKSERTLGSAGLLKKLVLLLKTPFVNMSLTANFDQFLSRWITLPDMFPVSIDDAVRFVSFSSVCDRFLSHSTEDPWDYEAVFEDDSIDVVITTASTLADECSEPDDVDTTSIDSSEIDSGDATADDCSKAKVQVISSSSKVHTDDLCDVNYNDVLFCLTQPTASSRFLQELPRTVPDLCYVVSGCSDGRFRLSSDGGHVVFIGNGDDFSLYPVSVSKRQKVKKGLVDNFRATLTKLADTLTTQRPPVTASSESHVFISRYPGDDIDCCVSSPANPVLYLISRKRWEDHFSHLKYKGEVVVSPSAERLQCYNPNKMPFIIEDPNLIASWDPTTLPFLVENDSRYLKYSERQMRTLRKIHAGDPSHFCHRPLITPTALSEMDKGGYNVLNAMRYAYCRDSPLLLHIIKPTVSQFVVHSGIPAITAPTAEGGGVTVTETVLPIPHPADPSVSDDAPKRLPEVHTADSSSSSNSSGTDSTNVTSADDDSSESAVLQKPVGENKIVKNEPLENEAGPEEPTFLAEVDGFPCVVSKCTHDHRLIKSSGENNMCFYNSLSRCLNLNISGSDCKAYLLTRVNDCTKKRSEVVRLLSDSTAMTDTCVVYHAAEVYKVNICIHTALDSPACRIVAPGAPVSETVCILQSHLHFDSLICRKRRSSPPRETPHAPKPKPPPENVEYVPKSLQFSLNPVVASHPNITTSLFAEFEELSPSVQRDYIMFKPVELPGDDLCTKVKNCIFEQLEYWRVYDGVLRDNLREIYSNLPISFTRKDCTDLASSSKAVCVWDCRSATWLVPPRKGVLHEFGFDGERYVALRSKLGKCKDLAEQLKQSKRDRIICTRETELMQEHRLLNACRRLNIADFDKLPEFVFINGVPGCGKTTFIINNHVPSEYAPATKVKPVPALLKLGDLVLTATRDAAADLRQRLSRSGIRADKFQYRTVDSYLLNRGDEVFSSIWVDEALMSHAGAVFMCAKFSGASKAYLIGDRFQIPYVARLPGIVLNHHSLCDVLPVAHTLNVSFRCPVDVAAALSDVYEPRMQSTNHRRRSMRIEKINGIADVPKRRDDVQYLTFTQPEKYLLAEKGYAPVNTVHEYQGKSCSTIWVVRLSHRTSDELFKKEAWAIVALSRHTRELVYYTPVLVDALAKRVSANISAADCQRATAAVDYSPPKLAGGAAFYLSPGLCGAAPQPTVNVYENLQVWYDSILHRDSTEDTSFDQYHVHHGDLSLAVGSLSLKLDRDGSLGEARPTLLPRLRTGATAPRFATQRETLLGFYKRNANVPDLQGLVADKRLVQAMTDKFLKAFIGNRKRDLFASYRTRKIVPSSIAIEEWLRTQPPHVVDQIVGEATSAAEKPLNEYLYMNKRDIKPALDGTATSEYKAVQTIAYNTKDINAIFCPIFRQISDRLLSVLDDRFLIFTQMSVSEFEERLTSILPPSFANLLFTKEVDFSKYDKSQGRVHLLFEIEIYKALGLDPFYAYLWYRAHYHTIVKDPSCGFLAWLQCQRKSGDAATFIGNTIVLMGMLSFMYDFDNICGGVFGGDDSVLWGKQTVLEQDKTYMAGDVFNMEVKFFKFRYVYFSSKFLISVGDRWRMIPDPLKIVFKLGRRDLVDWTHLEEYFISMQDHLRSFRDACINEVLSDAVTERYNTQVSDHTYCFAALARLSEDKSAFFSLFEDPGNLLIDPSRPKVF